MAPSFLFPTLGLAIATVTFLCDQLSKFWVIDTLIQPPHAIEVTSFLNIILVWNRGISFGLFDTNSVYGRWVLTAITATIALVLICWLIRNKRPTMSVALGFIVGGALGNIIDRIRFGAVADFLDFHLYGLHWPTFNIADSAIVAGVFLLLYETGKKKGG